MSVGGTGRSRTCSIEGTAASGTTSGLGAAGRRRAWSARGVWMAMGVAVLTLTGCGGLKYPMDKRLTKKSFESRRPPEEIELYFSHSSFVTTKTWGNSSAQSFDLMETPRTKPSGKFLQLRKIRSQLVVQATSDPGNDPPTQEMIDEGISQLQDAASEAGADALMDVFCWVLFDGIHYRPRGVVLQGIAIRYGDH